MTEIRDDISEVNYNLNLDNASADRKQCERLLEKQYEDFQFDEGLSREASKSYLFFKRLQDVIFSSVALLVLCIPMLIVAVIIKIDSPGGKVIFSQNRVGRNGKVFKLHKFRSMVPNAHNILFELKDKNEMDGPVFKIKDDPRITKFGRIMRKYCIDELPQLMNILKGDMSIVGPRPSLVSEVLQYEESTLKRVSVKPGLTCYWQAHDNRNDLSFDEWVELDIKYINECSFTTDWKIIFKTLAVVFSGDGI